MEREQKQAIINDLAKKIVLLVGPRQVGKTWLAKGVAKDFTHVVYLNYDSKADRQIIINEAWLKQTELLILDELHKMPDWKNFLKGVYDTKLPQLKILVTGSASLDVMKQIGDTLAGRFFTHHLLPFAPAELKAINHDIEFNKLLTRGGFPEPFLAEVEVDVKRWRMQYIDSLLRTDIFDIDGVHDLKAMRLVLEMLRSRVGSPVSYKSIAEDINSSLNTVKKYIQILEALYIVFRITPFSKNISRSLLKEPKIYFFDAGMVKGDAGIQLENCVAVCLLKHVYGKRDYAGEEYALHYLRTKEGKEVDFAIVHDDEVEEIIEVKATDHDISKNLKSFADKYNFPATQIVKELKREYEFGDIKVRKAVNYLQELVY